MEEILIDCSPGISGDMLLGAFHDLGVPKNVIEKTLSQIGLEKLYFLKFRESQSCSIKGIKVEVENLDQTIKRFLYSIKFPLMESQIEKMGYLL